MAQFLNAPKGETVWQKFNHLQIQKRFFLDMVWRDLRAWQLRGGALNVAHRHPGWQRSRVGLQPGGEGDEGDDDYNDDNGYDSYIETIGETHIRFPIEARGWDEMLEMIMMVFNDNNDNNNNDNNDNNNNDNNDDHNNRWSWWCLTTMIMRPTFPMWDQQPRTPAGKALILCDDQLTILVHHHDDEEEGDDDDGGGGGEHDDDEEEERVMMCTFMVGCPWENIACRKALL